VEVKAAVKIHETSQGATLMIDGNTSSDVIAQVEAFVVNTLPAKDRAKAKAQFEDHRAVTRAMQSPAEQGATFSSIPQLCIDFDGHLEVVEKETLSHLGNWSLLDQKIQLEGFSISESVNSFEIDVKGETVKVNMIDTRQLHLDDGEGHVSEKELVRWLDAETRQPDIGQTQLQAYLVKLVAHLIQDRRFNLLALVRGRFQLAQAIESEIARLRAMAMEKGFQARLFEMVVPSVEAAQHYSFNFQPGQYPARNHYSGSYEFSKHYYPVIHELHEKTKAGRPAEEFLCAQAIDAHKSVKHWVRNIERQPKFSFWLPTSSDYFYPDFVAELHDGRFLVVEYKGENLKTSDDSREKDQIGHQWEKASGGRCLFLMAVAKDDEGRDVFKQIEAKLS
jgi:type III restriction enzyme